MIYPPATQFPGPAEKQGYLDLTVNRQQGVVCHSMVGGYMGAMARLFSPDRASWHFSIRKTGECVQHYRTGEITWHAGSPRWNKQLIGIEHEGGAPGNESEPLTPAQLVASVTLVRWLARECGFPLIRRVGLWEHNELSGTQCPSGRIPWTPAYTSEEIFDMQPFMAWALDTQRLYWVGPFGSVWVTDPQDAATLETTYGKPKLALHESTLAALGGK